MAQTLGGGRDNLLYWHIYNIKAYYYTHPLIKIVHFMRSNIFPREYNKENDVAMLTGLESSSKVIRDKYNTITTTPKQVVAIIL